MINNILSLLRLQLALSPLFIKLQPSLFSLSKMTHVSYNYLSERGVKHVNLQEGNGIQG